MSRKWTICLVAALTLVGLALRLRGLGNLGFWGDEAYQALAVEGILKHGYPLLPSGAVYLRALPFQYLQAVSAFVFGLNEFALRFPGVLFGAAVIPAIYLLGRDLFGRGAGILAAAVLAFSVMEIDMSRFARVYTMLQFVYVLGLWSFYRGFMKGEKRFQLPAHALAVLAVLLHQIGLFLVLAYFIPLFIKGYQVAGRAKLAMTGVAIAVGGKLLGSVEHALSYGRVLEHSAQGGAGGLAGKFSTLFVPIRLDLFDPLMNSGGLLTLVFIALSALAGIYLVACGIRTRQWGIAISLFIVLIFSILQQLGLTVLVLAGLMLMTWRDPKLHSPWAYQAALSIIAGYGAFWFSYGVASPQWYEATRMAAEPQPALWVKLASLIGHYPRVGERFLFPYLKAWPVITVVSLGAALALIFRHILRGRAGGDFFAAAIYFFPLFLVGVAQNDNSNARYLFPVYAVMILLLAWMVLEFAGRTARNPVMRWALALTLALVVCTDADPVAAWGVASQTYATSLEAEKGVTSDNYGFHKDHQAAGRFVRGRAGSEDVIISFNGALDYVYAGRIEYYFVGNQMDIFKDDGYRKDVFTGVPLIKGMDDFYRVLFANGGRKIWILGFSQRDYAKEIYPAEVLRFFEALEPQRVFTARDARTPVYMIDGKAEPLEIIL
ncbi:MAG: glycosyltransferase family 39 protein [Candidatus Omnitrophica bacterium]|nr:glycosyltransferase family 39 protein [Candidatus Omnitrophota bacterium]